MHCHKILAYPVHVEKFINPPLRWILLLGPCQVIYLKDIQHNDYYKL